MFSGDKSHLRYQSAKDDRPRTFDAALDDFFRCGSASLAACGDGLERGCVASYRWCSGSYARYKRGERRWWREPATAARVQPAVPVDTTGDGFADSLGYDTTGDGKVDTVEPGPTVTVEQPA